MLLVERVQNGEHETLERGPQAGGLCRDLSHRSGESGTWSREKIRGAEEGVGKTWAGPSDTCRAPSPGPEEEGSAVLGPLVTPGMWGTASLISLRKCVIKQVSDSAITSNLIFFLFFFFLSDLFTNKLLLVITSFVLRRASLRTSAFGRWCLEPVFENSRFHSEAQSRTRTVPGGTEWPWEGEPCGQDATGPLPQAGDWTRRP